MKTMTNIFKKFLTAQALSKYTAKNPVEGKSIFEKTEFYKCIHGAYFFRLFDINVANQFVFLH